jgi:serine/threonine-protein kinase
MIIGQIIGNYKIEAKLGEGGMGAVYKGVDTMLDREVAIKALKPELASQTAIVERFRSEAVTLAKLQHPNIATLYSLFRQGDELYMVLEYVRGETLDTILQRRGALSAAEAIPVFSQVLDGIDHAHEYGIIHRDIKPANLMLTERGTLKVLDFGIARLLGSARMTRAGSIIGTLEYMAPEQVKGQETDARSDIYALGMMLYEVLTGKTPFDTENEFELMKLQTESMPILPRQINPNIPEAVEAAIMRDGMGGHAAGEVASEMAIELISAIYYADKNQSAQTALRNAVEQANREIYETSLTDEKFFGMGTTVIALVLLNNTAFAAHVGDSRLYRLRGQEMEMLTLDHSQVMEMVKLGIISMDEARNHADKNVILRAVGTGSAVEVEVSELFAVEAGDEFLLCSDGLSDMVEDAEIRHTWASADDIHVAVENLINIAKQRGGHDNITAGIVRVSSADEPETGGNVRVTREVEVL